MARGGRKPQKYLPNGNVWAAGWLRAPNDKAGSDSLKNKEGCPQQINILEIVIIYPNGTFYNCNNRQTLVTP